MKRSLEPTFIKYIGGNYIYWFETSNQYVIASDFLHDLLTTYLSCKNEEDFINKNKALETEESLLIYHDLSNFLSEANTYRPDESEQNHVASISSLNKEESHSFYYKIGNNTYCFKFSNHPIFNLIKERLTQFQISQTNAKVITYQFTINETTAYLLKNGFITSTYPLSKIHFLFGKFSLELISDLYSIEKDQWLATLHASTVCNDQEAIMLVGESGNGKSTLAGLCLTEGLQLIADDFTPLLHSDLKLYKNPSAISIKKGAFDQFEKLPKKLHLTEAKINPKKNVSVKYLQDKNFSLYDYSKPCNKIIYVKYNSNGIQSMSKSTAENILSALIPDSWISPKKDHALSFLNWISQCEFYELTYHENSFAINQVKSLFES